jgi:hypothetical protein
MITWNVSGINTGDIGDFLTNITLSTYWSVLLLQEFGCQILPDVLELSTGNIYICPGISSSSRSNAIAIESRLVPYVAYHGFCHVGGIVGLKFGNFFFGLVTAHIPHQHHSSHTLDHATHMLDNSLMVWIS